MSTVRTIGEPTSRPSSRRAMRSFGSHAVLAARRFGVRSLAVVALVAGLGRLSPPEPPDVMCPETTTCSLEGALESSGVWIAAATEPVHVYAFEFLVAALALEPIAVAGALVCVTTGLALVRSDR